MAIGKCAGEEVETKKTAAAAAVEAVAVAAAVAATAAAAAAAVHWLKSGEVSPTGICCTHMRTYLLLHASMRFSTKTQIHKNTNTQKHKYTKTQIHKNTNKQIHKHADHYPQTHIYICSSTLRFNRYLVRYRVEI